MTQGMSPTRTSSSRANKYLVSDRPGTFYHGNPAWNQSQADLSLENEKKILHARYPHIRDLQEKARTAVDNIDPHIPLRSLFGNAQQSANQVSTDVSFKRPDRAYIEYLTSTELLFNTIPKHKDFHFFVTNQEEWQHMYRSLCKKQDAQHEMFKQIYNAIVEDNTLSGIRPSLDSTISSDGAQLLNGRLRPNSMPERPASAPKPHDELFFASSHAVVPSSPSRAQRQHPETPQRERPPVHRKPDFLQLGSQRQDMVTRVVPDDELSERFSQLRVQRKSVPGNLAAQPRGPPQNGILQMPSPTEYTPSSSEESTSPVHHVTANSMQTAGLGKPAGPRELQLPSRLPPPPPKIPLDTANDIQLPKAPAAAYNPSRGNAAPLRSGLAERDKQQDTTNSAPASPRTTNGLSPTVQRINGYSSRVGFGEDDAEPLSQVSMSAISRSSQTIEVAELYEILQTSRVLLIDVRSRQEFDHGHIFAKSIMCVEPLSLKSGLSAEELEERLVISPAAEQSIFERRNDFDWVVYYDQRTQSSSFITGPPSRTGTDALRFLHDTLYEFNEYKPLQRPPVLLRGGLDAWMDLVGPQALATTKTAALVGSTRARAPLQKPGRPIGRVPMASANSSLEVRKRRLRDQQPLTPDEERTWVEKAHNEEIDPSEYPNAHSDADTDSNDEEPPSPFVHTYEDFLKRFPEAPSTQQSMMISLPPPPPRHRPPLPPPPPLPSVPSRPAPAVPRPSYGGVSDRDNAQFSPISRQSSSVQPPLYTSRSISRYLKLPRTGLVNFSVTCYMNATIQCLIATIPISQFFLDNKWKDLTQKNWKGSNGIMPQIFANLVKNLWLDDGKPIRPSSLRNFCARLNREWGVDRQQDAKEFFDFIIDCLHEDLNINWQRSPLNPLTSRQEMDRERLQIRDASRIEWDRYTHRESSYISERFAGQHASRLRCTTCHNTSTTYEAFYSISVEIPRTQGKRPWDIHDCLRSYCKEERLSGDEVWKCPYCKCDREATKQIIITRAPQFMVVHFKRFEMRRGESAKKVHTPIHFPLYGLNMESYMVPSASATASAKSHYVVEAWSDPATTAPYLYDAYAVMRHIGSSGNGGHYIALVRDAARGNVWRKFDDDKVTDFDPNKLKADASLQNEQAYIVFYGRAVAR